MTTTTTIPVYGAQTPSNPAGLTPQPTTPTPSTPATSANPANLTPVPTTAPTPSQTSSSSAGTSGTFPGAQGSSALNDELIKVATQLQSVPSGQFFSAYKISSADQQTYLTSTGQLNNNATYLAWYKNATQSDRQNIQTQMVTAGLMPAASANGLDNTTALGTFTSLLGQAMSMGSNVLDYLNQVATPEHGLQNQISAN